MRSDLELRSATADDRPFLLDMLLEAANWEPGRAITADDVRRTPHLFHYVDRWPGASDLGVVAEAGGISIGGAWLTHLTSADPGYGYVADDIPELSIGVIAEWRGRGVGRRLLRAVAARAAAAGLHTISLSVERANDIAVELYRSEGWVTAAAVGDADADTMLLHLDTT